MTTVTLTLGPDVRAVDGSRSRDLLRRRLRLSRAAVERLAARAHVPLPWDLAASRTDLAAALGDPPPAPATEGEPDTELRRSGLLLAGEELHPDVAAALLTFARPEVFVDLTLALPRPAGTAQLAAWHRLAGGRVTALTATARACELAWFDVGWWHRALVRLVAAPRPEPDRPAPSDGLRLPLELVLGSGEALRTQREDVLAELLSRFGSQVTVDGTVVTPQGAREVLRALHLGVQGRLQAVVGSGETRRIGLVGWLLFSDGWRELAAEARRPSPLVSVGAVRPEALGTRVARLVAGVRP
ncbi:MAG: hypothetical protein U0R80_14190 [Nocardioidaceae bacterium]